MLATKLRCPSIPPKRVQRPQLMQRLNEGLELGRQMTLISAPAGFGKSTCAAEWAGGLDLPTAWVSLDRSDDDPARFFAYVVAALKQVDKTLCRDIERVLNSGQLPPAEVISAGLINDIMESGVQFLLVLDDFQVIQDRAIQEALARLVTNQPRNMHLVLLTREDPSLPLARLRANNQITEIRAADLRLSLPETDSFLNEVMGLGLSPADVTALEEKTEGWIAGLQLAGLSVRDRPDPSGFVARLSGSHRYILSYLTEEVLDLQPPEVQSFLLQTAILNRLNGALCDAVTGRTDSADLLEKLFHANLFLIPLDDEQRWYRYHHLFAGLLRNVGESGRRGAGYGDAGRQGASRESAGAGQNDELAELHRRASCWYAQAGMASEAIGHALEAADYEMAVQLLEANTMQMVVQGYAKTVEEWLNAIPAEMRLRSPKTDLAFAWMHLMRGTVAEAAPYLERLQREFSRAPVGDGDFFPLDRTGEEASSLQAEWLALQSFLLIGQGNVEEGLGLATQVLEMVRAGRGDAGGYVRSLAYMGLTTSYQLMGRYAEAVEVCQKAILNSRAAGNFVSEVLSVATLTQIALQHGEYHLAFGTASQMLTRLEGSASLPPMSSVVYGTLGQVCYQWGQFEQARRHFLRSIQLSALGGYTDGEIHSRALFSRLLHLEGDLEGAGRELQIAAGLVRSGAAPWVRLEVASEQVRACLAQGHLAAAEAVLMGHGLAFHDELSSSDLADLAPDRTISHEDGLLYNSALRVLLRRAGDGVGVGAGDDARHDPATSLRWGIDFAGRLVDRALKDHFVPMAVKTLLLRAQMFAALGDRPTSLAECRRALELAEPEGLISTFVEEGPHLAETLAALLKEGQLKDGQSGGAGAAPSYVQTVLDAFRGPGQRATGTLESPAPAGPAPAAPFTPAAGEMLEPLSPRELEVLSLVEVGCSNQEISARLVLSLHTVKKHISNIFSKMGVGSRTQAVARARQLGLLR